MEKIGLFIGLWIGFFLAFSALAGVATAFSYYYGDPFAMVDARITSLLGVEALPSGLRGFAIVVLGIGSASAVLSAALVYARFRPRSVPS